MPGPHLRRHGGLGAGSDLKLPVPAGRPVLRAVYKRQVRVPRTARVQRSARVWGDIWHIDGTGALLRNELFRGMTDDDYSYADWLWGWQPPTG